MVFAGSSPETPGPFYDSQREREFYRYYDPIRALSASGPRLTNLYDEAAAKRHQPSSCPDLSLTAFCQLGALRLAARRCMLFFFDRTSAYVMAEATRTLSLHDDQVHEAGDALWLGFTIIPRGLSVCEHTVNVGVGTDDTSTEEKHPSSLLHIIDDMRGSARFCDRPYVTDGPKARFYAGVPIITPGGLRIGAYCVLDDKPRDGLTEPEVKFMLETAKTVMSHLETVRERAEFGRGTRMLKGLRSFVQEASTRRLEEPTSATRVHFATDDNRNSAPAQHVDEIAKLTGATPDVTSQPFERIHTPPARLHSVSGMVPPYQRGTMTVQNAPGAEQVFQNAADLVRDAMDAEGCVFLDVASELSGKIPGAFAHRRTYSDNSGGCGTDTGSEFGDADRKPIEACSFLGQSFRSFDAREKSSGVPSATLRRLLRKYPRGKIWNFNIEGDVLSSDQLTDTHVKQTSSPAVGDGGRKRKKHYRSAADDAAELRTVFPAVRSLCLVGLWDLRTHRWRAGVFVWSHSPVRVFSVKGELNFVIAFGEVIMGEVAAIEAKRDEKKRSDFVSSISHELRSPLHGILGSIDMINQDHPLLRNMTDIKQIESCTLTMLDLVEHLLSYAESKRGSTSQQSLDSVASADSDESPPERQRPLNLTPGTSIASATEEIAGVVMHAHQCDTSLPGSDRVDMALDISVGADYLIRAGPGDWKRLCSVIIGNALKFTEKGHVLVSLRLSKKRRRSLAVLEVTDTGRGMSQEFMQDGLFRAFQQEDGLRAGMGLGVTLASKIVRGLGGKMQVQSEQGRGTTFRVIVPVEFHPPGTELASVDPSRRDFKIHVCDFAEVGEDPRDEIFGGVLKTTERLGTKLVPIDAAKTIILFEERIEHFHKQQDTNPALRSKPLVVLCRDTKSIQRHKEATRHFPNPHIEFIPQPYGPRRLAGALRKGLGLADATSTPEAVTTAVQIERPDPQLDLATLKSAFAALPTPSAAENEHRSQAIEIYTEAGAEPPVVLTSRTEAKKENIVITARSIDLSTAPDLSPSECVVSKKRPTQSGLCLLLVDDNPVNLRLLITYAAKNGHPHLTATNGREAVDAYSEAIVRSDAAISKPNVVLLDMNMPVMDGFEAARCIRNLECLYNVPAAKIIALTGLGSEQAKLEAVQSGIDMFLTKPVRLKELAGILAGLRKKD